MSNAAIKSGLIALFILIVSVAVSVADEYGCKVLLCMSNPDGPKAVSECVPPIDKLLSDMSKPNFSWPRCEEAESGGSRIVPTNERHEPCPNGYTENPAGIPAITKADYQKATNPAQWVHYREEKYLKWIYPIYFSASDEYGEINRQSSKDVLCGRGGSGRADIARRYENGDGEVKYRVYDNAVVYDEIRFAKRLNAAMVVDVYIGGKFYKRVPLNY